MVLLLLWLRNLRLQLNPAKKEMSNFTWVISLVGSKGSYLGKIKPRHEGVQDSLGCCGASWSIRTQLAAPCPGAEHRSHQSSIPQPRASPGGRVSAGMAPARCRSGGMLLLLTLHRVPRTRLQLELRGELTGELTTS